MWCNVLHIDHLCYLIEKYGSSVYEEIVQAGFWTGTT